MTHSPLPWRTEEIAGLNLHVTYDASGEQLFGSDYFETAVSPADQATIVRAVNAHAALVAALEDALDCIPNMAALDEVFDKVAAALKLARGEV